MMLAAPTTNAPRSRGASTTSIARVHEMKTPLSFATSSTSCAIHVATCAALTEHRPTT